MASPQALRSEKARAFLALAAPSERGPSPVSARYV
jgi:hypothetical protein